MPLDIRSKIVTEMEVLRIYAKSLPMVERLEKIKNRPDVHGLTWLEKSGIEKSELIRKTCRARLRNKPRNLKIVKSVKGEKMPERKAVEISSRTNTRRGIYRTPQGAAGSAD